MSSKRTSLDQDRHRRTNHPTGLLTEPSENFVPKESKSYLKYWDGAMSLERTGKYRAIYGDSEKSGVLVLEAAFDDGSSLFRHTGNKFICVFDPDSRMIAYDHSRSPQKSPNASPPAMFEGAINLFALECAVGLMNRDLNKASGFDNWNAPESDPTVASSSTLIDPNTGALAYEALETVLDIALNCHINKACLHLAEVALFVHQERLQFDCDLKPVKSSIPQLCMTELENPDLSPSDRMDLSLFSLELSGLSDKRSDFHFNPLTLSQRIEHATEAALHYFLFEIHQSSRASNDHLDAGELIHWQSQVCKIVDLEKGGFSQTFERHFAKHYLLLDPRKCMLAMETAARHIGLYDPFADEAL